MKDNVIFENVLRYVMTLSEEEFAELTVARLANSQQIDRFSLSRLFKKRTDMTLEDFLFRQKMTRALFMLTNRDEITIKEVSQKIGFCTSDYFIRKFREFYGIAPGKYRGYIVMDGAYE